MKIKTAHCLFEQSGTFKNEFVKLGVPAFDYDIANTYNQTDFVMDLFSEIEGGYRGGPSVFDAITPDDIILAFYPCTRFECQCSIWFRGEAYQQQKWSDTMKLEKCLAMHEELTRNYTVLTKLVLICLERNLRLIIENPANKPHYLSSYWALKPSIVDTDRTRDGDRQKKPTQYWFINCEPENNLCFEPLEPVERRTHQRLTGADGKSRAERRSEIHPQYARRFIKKYIL